jgi:hypothetical protein
MSHHPGHRRDRTGTRVAALLSVLLVSGPLAAQPQPSPGAEPAAPVAVDKPASPRRHRVLIMDLKAVGVEASLVTVLGGLITDAVARYPSIQTISTSDIRNLVELETGKQQVGCDTTSCLAEVAGAMGAEYVVFGNVGMLGTTTVVQLSLFDAAQAQAVARRSIKVASHEELATAVEPAVADLLQGLIPEEQRRAVTAVTTTTRPTPTAATTGNDLGWMRWLGAIAAVGGGLGLGVVYFGGVLGTIGGNAPGEFVQLMAIPLVGPPQAAALLQDEINKSSDGGPPEWAVPLMYGMGGLQAAMALTSVLGLGGLSFGLALEGEGLPLLGHVWQWGLLALGGGLAAGGIAFDVLYEGAHDHTVGPTDFVGPAMYLLAAVAGGSALLFNPFTAEGE